MDNHIVFKPEPVHHCNPGCTEYIVKDSENPFLNGLTGIELPSIWSHPAGTVVECECGKVYVAYKTPDSQGMMNISGVSFRRERWWERRKRLRKSEV